MQIDKNIFFLDRKIPKAHTNKYSKGKTEEVSKELNVGLTKSASITFLTKLKFSRLNSKYVGLSKYKGVRKEPKEIIGNKFHSGLSLS